MYVIVFYIDFVFPYQNILCFHLDRLMHYRNRMVEVSMNTTYTHKSLIIWFNICFCGFDYIIQYSVNYNFSAFCKSLNLETENVFKKSILLIMATSKTKKKMSATNLLWGWGWKLNSFMRSKATSKLWFKWWKICKNINSSLYLTCGYVTVESIVSGQINEVKQWWTSSVLR